MTPEWIVSQCFAFVALILVIISFQQKSTLKLIVLRNIATIITFIGLCFLGNISAIILCGAGIIRNATTLIFALKPTIKKIGLYKIISGLIIVILLITFNVIFWSNWLNLLSILTGTMNVIAYLQSNSSKIRIFSVVAEIIAITYFTLLLSPINIIIEAVGLISAVVGIIRLDILKKTNVKETAK